MPRDDWELLLKRAQKKNLQLSSFMPHLLLLKCSLVDEHSKTLALPNPTFDDTVVWDLASSTIKQKPKPQVDQRLRWWSAVAGKANVGHLRLSNGYPVLVGDNSVLLLTGPGRLHSACQPCSSPTANLLKESVLWHSDPISQAPHSSTSAHCHSGQTKEDFNQLFSLLKKR